jgi:hypothetical protein
MAAIPYTKRMLITRIRRHATNELFASDEFPITENEILLYIDAAIPPVMKGQMFENAKVTGFLDMPEAYLVTYNITPLTNNKITLESYGTLPQMPLALPQGYQITDAYFVDNSGKSNSVIFVKVKNVPYRNLLPAPSGVFGRLEGNVIFIKSTDGQPLYGQNLYVQMPISRTDDVDAPMSIPDDAIEPIFNNVIMKIKDRYGIPMDIIKDNLGAGNKSS